MVRLIDSGSALGSGRFTVDVHEGAYQNFLLELYGTTDTAQTLLLSDIGRIRVLRQGRELQGETFEFFHKFTAIHAGYPDTVTGNAATAENIACIIPCQLPGLPNVLLAESREEIDIILEFGGNLDTRFGANPFTWNLYGITNELLAERYELQVFEQDQTPGGATTLTDLIQGVNIAALYLRDPSSIVTQIQVMADGNVEIDNIRPTALNTLTNIRNQVESSGNDLIQLLVASGPTILQSLNRSVRLQLSTSTSGTIEVTGIKLAPAKKQGKSIERAKSFAAARVASQSGLGAGAKIPVGTGRVR